MVANAHVESTADVHVPTDVFQQIIGQEEAVEIAHLAARQRRHLLLVGPPGTGKSLIAQALSFTLPKPTQEISVLHNPENPERPMVEVRSVKDIERERKLLKELDGRLTEPKDVPAFVAERLGFRCRHCGKLSKSNEEFCPNCGMDKFSRFPMEQERSRKNKVHTTRQMENGKEEIIIYERLGEKIRVLDEKTLSKIDEFKKSKPRKVIVSADRKNFIAATGASETELLGDVRHDPYGGHYDPEDKFDKPNPGKIGTYPYRRVVAGSIHEAHEGVLFIDELSTMQNIQRYMLTAIQDRKFPIVGKNPQSAGASVRVDNGPCDFILVAATNISDLPMILPALRSRILGNGYEVLLKTTMPDTPENRVRMLQFISQEIRKDGKIPHASLAAAEALMAEAGKRALKLDGETSSLSLRLRELSGVLRLAGDFAVHEGSALIEPQHVQQAIIRGAKIEDRLRDQYGSLYKAGMSEYHSYDRKAPAEFQ